MSVPSSPSAGEPAAGLLRRAWERWKRIAHAIGVFQTRLIMSLLYFVIVLPLGLVVRVVGDPLGLRKPAGSNWQRLEPHPRSLESAHQQF